MSWGLLRSWGPEMGKTHLDGKEFSIQLQRLVHNTTVEAGPVLSSGWGQRAPTSDSWNTGGFPAESVLKDT